MWGSEERQLILVQILKSIVDYKILFNFLKGIFYILQGFFGLFGEVGLLGFFGKRVSFVNFLFEIFIYYLLCVYIYLIYVSCWQNIIRMLESVSYRE